MFQAAHNKAEICFLKMSRILKAKAPTKFIEDFEKSLSRVLSKEYDEIANKALKAALKSYKGNQTEAQIKAIEKALLKEFDKFGPAIEGTVEDQIKVFYETQTTQFIKDYGLKVQKASSTDPEIFVDFTLQDSQAIAASQRITVQSAGRYFPDQLSDKTSTVIRQIVLKEGLDTATAAKMLEAELKGALGLDFDKAVPTQYHSNPTAYFDIVANNASVQATNVGRMIAMADAGVEKYRVVAIIDRLTSAICRSLDGKTFSVSNGMKAAEGFFGAQSLEDLQNVMGFSKDGSVPTWAAEGMGFPPYHHKCRTTVVPEF